MKKPTLVLLSSAILATPGSSASISVNLSVNPVVDGQLVDPGESSVTGIAGAESVDGANWNNINLRNTGSGGAPTFFTTATQGSNHIDLKDSTGLDSGINMTSSGAFFANFSNITPSGSQGTTGDAALMQGFLLLLDTETISLSGLSAWAPDGYKVIAFFDIGNATRTYGISMTDGAASQTFWTADTPIDSDANNDGVIEWLQTSATTSGSAVTNANFAVSGTFTGNTFTLSGNSDPSGARAVLSGFQIVAVPEPSSAVLLGTFGLLAFARRRR